MIRIVGILFGLSIVLLAPNGLWAESAALQRKAALVDNLLKDSDTSRRVHAKGDAASRSLLDQAAQAREEARRALAAGDEKKGSAFLDKALQLVTTASRNNVDPASRQWLHRSRYEDLLVSVDNFKDAYARHLRRLRAGEKGPMDLAQVESLKAQALALGKEKKYEEANKSLSRAQEMVTTGLKSLLGSTALVYELKFDTPKDEYEYEVRRGESYEAMIRMFLAEGVNPKADEGQLRPLMDKSQETSMRADQQASAGQFEVAIKTREEANKLLTQVLRMLGVMIPM
ncbi:MAG: hypothetical protein HQL93_07160 [Magnetococcales bacterium]|nr:hypothetical protein [Magnetococcales bacterium]